MYKITKISQAKKNPERANLFLDDEFWVSLTKNQLVQLGLYKNQEIDDVQKQEIEKANVDGKLLEKVMKWLSLRPRSELETFQYLRFSRNVDKQNANQVIDELYSKQLLDDAFFANWFVENRVEYKMHGPRKIYAHLLQKGITSRVAQEALKEKYPELIQIQKLEKFFQKHSVHVLDQKMIRKLLSRGFEYEQITIAFAQNI